MVMYHNKFVTKEDKIEPQHIHIFMQVILNLKVL